MPSNIQGWNSVKADFSDASRTLYTAQQGLSNAGTIFGQLRASILEEEQRRIDNALKEKTFNEGVRQFGITSAETARGHNLNYNASIFGNLVQARGQDIAAQTAREKLLDERSNKIADASETVPVYNTGNQYNQPQQFHPGNYTRMVESNGNSSTVNWNDNGKGISVGQYQLNENAGSIQSFIDKMSKVNPNIGQLNGLKGKELGKAWQSLVASGDITPQMQQDFVTESHYKPAIAKLQDANLQNLVMNSPNLQTAVFDMAIQHGATGAANLINSVYKPGMSEQQIIEAASQKRGEQYGQYGADRGNKLMQYFQQPPQSQQYSPQQYGPPSAKGQREAEIHNLDMTKKRQELITKEVSRLTRAGLYSQNIDDFTKEVAASNIPDDMKQKLTASVTAARTANGGSELAAYEAAQNIVASLTGEQLVAPDLADRYKALKDRITTTEQKLNQSEQDAYNKHLQALSDITNNMGSKHFRQKYEKATQMLISAGIAPRVAYETMRQFAFTDALSYLPTYENNDQITEFLDATPDKLWKTTIGSKALQAQKASKADIANLKNGLRKAGLTDSEIDKILKPKSSGGTLTQKDTLSSTSTPSLLENKEIKDRMLKLGVTENELGQVGKLAQDISSKDYLSALYMNTSEYIDSAEPKVQPRHYIEAARQIVSKRQASAEASARKQEEEEREKKVLAAALDEAEAASKRVHEIRRPVTNEIRTK